MKGLATHEPYLSMPFTPETGRCRNCTKKFPRTQAHQKFCSDKCRSNFHRYGKTPLDQLVQRLRGYMKSAEFREMMREEVRKAVAELNPAATRNPAALGTSAPSR